MRTKHYILLTDSQRGIQVGRLALAVVIGCVLALSGAGCAEHTRPVSANDIGPIQRHPGLRRRTPQPAGEQQIVPAPTVESPLVIAATPSATVPESVISLKPPTERAQRAPEAVTPAAQMVEIPRRETPSANPAAETNELQPSSVVVAEPAPSVVAAPPEPPRPPEEMVQVNFEEVDIRTVLKTIGEITGINFIPHQSVSGTVTVMSPTPIRLSDIYPFLQSILDVHGYAAIEADNVVKIVPKADASKRNLQVRIGADPAMIPKNDTIATQFLPLKYANATEVTQIVQPLLSTGALMATYPRTNSIMVTDTSANIHHIAQIVAQLDVEGSRENVLLFPLTHASAQVLSEQIMRILDEGRAVASGTPGRARPVQIDGQGTRVLPDDRTNSLIVVGAEQDVDTIRKLVAQLDVERPIGADNVHVTYLRNADANDVAPSLEAALAGMRLTDVVDARQQIQVTADPSTNSLIIVASPQDFTMISGIVEKLDIVREQVLVEMTILEVGEDALKALGVDWATLDEAVSNSVRGFGFTNLGPMVNYVNGDLEGLAVGAWQDTGSGVQVGAILQALQKETGVNILSTPSLLTSNHRKARIVVGENTPFVVQSRVTETTDFLTPTVIKQYEYKDVGITLEITPHVSQGGSVRLQIDSEFTKLIDSVTAASADTPTTAKRSAQTVVTMGSGNTVVIGGLIRDDKTRVQNKVPVVGDVPVIGTLFRWQRDRVQKTNLLIFITPHVMTSQEELQEMTDKKREQMLPLLEAGR